MINGAAMTYAGETTAIPDPAMMVQVMTDDEISERRDPVQRLPRQASHYAQIVSHFLAVKNSTQIARAMSAHFERLRRYHGTLLGSAVPDEDAVEE